MRTPDMNDIGLYVLQIEELLNVLDSTLADFIEAEGLKGPAGQVVSRTHTLIGATQTIATALAVRAGVRVEA